MVLTRTSVLMVEWAPQNGTPSVYVCVGSPSSLLPLRESLQDQQVCLTEMSFKLLLLHWDLEWLRFCVYPLRVEPTCVSHMHTPLAFKPRHSRGSSSRCRTPGLGSLMWGLDPLLLGENLCNWDYLSICGSSTQGCGSWLYCVSDPLSHLIVVFCYIFSCGQSFCQLFS